MSIKLAPLESLLAFLTLLLLSSGNVFSQTIYTLYDGNWNTSSTWFGGTKPTSTDGSCSSGSVSSGTCNSPVAVGNTITIDANISISSGVYYFGSNGTSNTNTNITDAPGGTAYSLTMSNTGSNISTNNVLDIKSGTTTFEGGATLKNANLYIRSGATLVVGSMDLSTSGSCNILVEAGGTLIINGNLVDGNNGGSFVVSGTLQVNGNYSTSNGNVVISGTGSFQTTGSMTTTGGTSTIFGSANDCGTGPCSGGALPCGSGGTAYSSSISPSSSTVCSGGSQTLTFSSNANPTPGTSGYQWQSSTDNINWTSISGATSTTYSASPSVTTWYRMSYAVTGCATLTSPSAKVFVALATNTPSTQTICSSGSAALLGNQPVSPTTGTWSVVSGPSTSSSQFSSTSAYNAIFTPSGGAGTYVVRWTISSSSPSCTTTADATITVVSSPVASVSISSSLGSTICASTSVTFTASPTNGGTSPHYQWQKNGTNISGATSSTYSTSSLVAGDVIKVVMTSSLSCASGSPATSNTMTVSNNNTSTLNSAAGTNAQTVCINSAIASITYATTGATGATFSGLPSGVSGSWSGNVATISGTPTASGSFTYTVTLTGGCGSVTSTGTITVNPNNTSTLSSAAGTNAQTVCINSAVASITYATTGATGATFSGLPSGVSGSWSGNVATISGTPTASGSFTYTVTLTGGCGSVTSTGTITVNPNNTSTLSSAAGTNAQSICFNNAITTITYATTGATGATFSGLPSGVSGSWSGNVATISGTPTASGSFSYTVTLTGGCGSVTSTGSINVNATNTSTLSSAIGTNAQSVCINSPITSITYATTGATGATFSGLPSGVSGSWSGNVATISGTPTASGSFTYTVTLTGGCGSVTSTGTITINPNNTSILSSAVGTNAQSVCINSAITSITYATTGATGASFSGLPSGVSGSWSGSVATISGTPTVSGSFTYTVTLTGGCGSVTSTGTITVGASGTTVWTGSISTDWSSASNWTCGLPGSTVDADIPSGVVNYPVISSGATVDVKNITIETGASLQMNSTSVLQVSGNFTNNQTFTAGGGTIKFVGSGRQDIGGSAITTFGNITITNNHSPVSVSIESSQNLSGVLTLGTNSVFDADGSADASVFTLLSTSDKPKTADASIATLPSETSSFHQVIGKVTVQRYMGRSGVALYNYHAWRDISSPVVTTVSDLQKSLPITGSFANSSTLYLSYYGVGDPRNVVDGTVNYNISALQLYKESVAGSSSNGWTNYPLAGGDTQTSAFDPGRGYILFIFGSDYPVLQNNNANWSLTGVINSGSINMPVTLTKTGTGGTYNASNDGWNLVGNPYPSTIDWKAASGWTKTNINDAIYIDDYSAATPTYATYINGVGTNGGSQYIGVGQGFLVKANTNTTAVPVLAVDERVKKAGQQTTFIREQAPKDLLKIALGSGLGFRDEMAIYFSEDATSDFNSKLDAYKLENRDGFMNLSSTVGGEKFAIKAIAQSGCSKTIALDVSNVTSGTYSLSFTDFESMSPSIGIHLKDKFTNTEVDVRKKSNYSFTTDLDNPASFGAGRFSLKFSFEGSKSCAEPSQSIGVNAYPNPVDGIITLETTESESAQAILYNALGEPLATLPFTSNGSKQIATYDFGRETSGLYFFKVVQGNKISTVRVVKN